MFECYKDSELRELIIGANKELLKRHCEKCIHCEKCMYIYNEEDCEVQHLINFVRGDMNNA